MDQFVSQFVELARQSLLVFIVCTTLSLLFLGRGLLREMRSGLSESGRNLFYLTGFLVSFGLAPRTVTDNALTIHSAGADFMASLPGPLQFALALLLYDAKKYWIHRLQHTRWLWPLHAIHHCDTHLTWMNFHRQHPLEPVMASALSILLLMALGIPPLMIAGAASLHGIYGYYIHQNLPLSHGPLRYVLVSPRMHRVHHSLDHPNCNYGGMFAFNDVLFGTYRDPGQVAIRTGVEDLGPDDGIVGQMIYPFRAWARMLRAGFRRVRQNVNSADTA